MAKTPKAPITDLNRPEAPSEVRIQFTLKGKVARLIRKMAIELDEDPGCVAKRLTIQHAHEEADRLHVVIV